MKSRLFMSLLVALFMMSNVFAGTPLEDGLVLKGEFSQIGTRSLDPAIPIEATFEGNVLIVEFTAPVGDVNDSNKGCRSKCVHLFYRGNCLRAITCYSCRRLQCWYLYNRI